jgi:hypothetical protein
MEMRSFEGDGTGKQETFHTNFTPFSTLKPEREMHA